MPFGKNFPSTADLERVKSEHEYYRLYKSDVHDPDAETDRGKFRLKEFFENDTKKAKLLDIALNLAPIIADAGTDFLFGEPFRVEVDDEGAKHKDNQEKIDAIIERNDLHEKFAESSALFQAVGHAHFKLYKQDNLAVIDEVPYDYWFPNWAGVPLGKDTQNVRLAVYLTHVDTDDQEKKYIYVEDYYLKDKQAVIGKSLWEDRTGQIGDQVELSKLQIPVASDAQNDAAQPLTKIEKTGLTKIPLVSINLRKTVKERLGESIFKKVRPLLFEVNDRLTQISIQFLKHLNAKLEIPEGSVDRDPKTGKVIRVNMEVLLKRAGEEGARYITNENPLVEQAFEHLEKVIRKIAKLTQTPDTFLTEDEKGGVEKAEALRTRLLWFLSRIRRYQRKYEAAIIKLIRIALEIEGVKDVEKIPLVVTFPSSLPKDWDHAVQVWGEAKAMGLASQETAVGQFQGIEGDELAEELQRIEGDEKKAMQSQLELKTAQPPDDDEDGEEE